MNEEKEIKILLSEEEYYGLSDLFVWSKEYVQINHYYGSEKDINSKTNTYRVREKNGKILLQIKIPEVYEGSLHIKKEYEQELDTIPKYLDKKELSSILGYNLFENKEYLGKLVTRRKVCLDYENVEICLDKNEYFDNIDYEIEIEFTNDYPENIIHFLKQYGIQCDNEVDGKYTRYLKKYYL